MQRPFTPREKFLMIVHAVIIMGAFWYYHPGLFGCGEAWRTCGPNPIAAVVAGFISLLRSPLEAYLVVLFGAYGAVLLWHAYRTETMTHTITMTPFGIGVRLFLFQIISVVMLVALAAHAYGTPISTVTLVMSSTLKIGIVWFAMAVFLVLMYAVGRTILQRFGLFITHPVDAWIIAVVVGSMCYSMVSFALGLIGILQLVAVVCVAVLGAYGARTVLSEHVRSILHRRVTMTVSLTALGSWLTVGMLGLSVYGALYYLLPDVLGFDANYRYLNTINLITESRRLITDVFPYAFELIMSYGTVVWGRLEIAIAMSVVAAGMAYLGIVTIARRFMSTNTALSLTAALFATTMMVHQFTLETKVDFGLLLVVVALVIALLEFAETAQKRLLVLIGALLGFAITIKFTAVLLLVALGIAVLYRARVLHTVRVTTHSLLIVCVAMAGIGAPWIAKHLYDADGTITAYTITHGAIHEPVMDQCDARLGDGYTDSSGTYIPFTSVREELGRYVGYDRNRVLAHALLPWKVTMNVPLSTPVNTMTFLWLAWLPACIAAVLARSDARLRMIGVTTAVYFVLWVVFGAGVLWYGLPGFIGLVILLGVAIEHADSPWFRRIAQCMILISVLSAIVFTFSRTPELSAVQYFAGQPMIQPHPHSRVPHAVIVGQALSEDPQGFALRGVPAITYYVAENDTRLYIDDRIDTMACLIRTQPNTEQVIETLRAKNIRYLVFDLGLDGFDQTPEGSLRQKMTELRIFLQEGLAHGHIEAVFHHDGPPPITVFRILDAPIATMPPVLSVPSAPPSTDHK